MAALGSLSTRLAAAAATAAAAVYLIFGTAFFGILSIVFGGFGPPGRFVFRCARGWGRGWLLAVRVRARPSFEEQLTGSSYVFMVNHQSVLDIPALLATLPVSTRFMAKEELFRLPVLGRALRAGGFVPVARGDKARARESFRAAVARLQEGASVLLFPEETRSADGRLLPFKRGGFLLATRSRTPIVPVGVRGTRQLQPKGRLLVRPGVVEVRYGRPIVPQEVAASGGDLAALVRERIAALAGVEDGEAPHRATPGDGSPADGKVATGS